MLSAIVRFSIERRGVVLVAAVALVAYGLYRLAGAGLDIFPEFAPQLVIVQTEAPGFTAEQVEVRVTQPLEAVLGGLVDLDHTRSESIQGLSILTLVFDDGSDTWRNRAQVAERLARARATLPVGAREPVIAPLASSSATVRTIGLTTADGDLVRLRDVTATMLVPRLLSAAGVADVNVFGGLERALVVEPDMAALARAGFDLEDLVAAVAAASGSPGLGVVENANQQLALASDAGTITPRRLARAPLGAAAGALTVGDVGRVAWGSRPRISAAQVNGEPAVVMMVIGQLGANTLTVSKRLEAAFADLRPLLEAQGITLHDRLFVPANYITTAIGDIGWHLLVGAALVLVVLLLGLYNLRTALISALAIPLSLLSAVIVLVECGVNLNVLVIGGLAIALGEVVDDAVIDTENIYRRLRTAPADAALEAIALAASLEVRGAVVFATFIVALVFVPLLTLGGVSGRLFAPLGVAYILAVVASLAVAVTVTPALCVTLLSRRVAGRGESPLFRLLNPTYSAAVAAIARRPGLALTLGTASAVVTLALLPTLGARFLPDLREGHFIVHTTGLPGTSLDESIRVGTHLGEAFRTIDGVRSVSQWAGRAERGADTYGSHYSEFEVALEPMSGTRQQAVLDGLRAVLARQPGISFEANTFLTERIDETISGYTAPVVVNIFGRDLDGLDATADELAALMAAIPGARNVRVRASHGLPVVSIALDAERQRRYQVSTRTVVNAVEAAFAGAEAGTTHRFNQALPVLVILSPDARSRLDQVGSVIVDNAPPGRIRLRDVAGVHQDVGRYNVLHRNGQRLQVVTAEVEGRDLAAFSAELKSRVRDELTFAEGTSLEFTGAAVEQATARAELVSHALLCGLGVLLLVYTAVGRLRYLGIILFNLPFSLLGGVVAVVLTGGVVSVGSVVGFVTLFGITVRNSIMLVSHYQHLVAVEGLPWTLDTALRGARERLPAILMTALVTALAMLPLTIDSDNPGREIMGPMAAIIIGGLVSSTLLNLLVMPALLYRYGRFGAESA